MPAVGKAAPLSDSHWGSTSLKGPLLTILVTAVLATTAIGIFAWSPWEEPTDVEWLETYEAWADGVDATLGPEGAWSPAACEASFDEQVGNPPSGRLDPVAAAVLRGCADPSASGRLETQEEVVRTLVAVHGELVPPTKRRDLTTIVRSSVGVQPSVYCWAPEAWTGLSEQYAIVRGGEEVSLRGIADRTRSRIDLDPSVCATLDRYVRRLRPPTLSSENLDLGEALIVLTHQAQHVKTPGVSEAEAECIAMQHVRPLVEDAWEPRLANEIALLAWEVSYPRLPEAFRSPSCRDGRAYDRNPSSSVWP